MKSGAILTTLTLSAGLAMGSLMKHQNHLPSLAASGHAPLTTSTGSKCGKGYTYCGYMLQTDGHSKFISPPLSHFPPLPRRSSSFVRD